MSANLAQELSESHPDSQPDLIIAGDEPSEASVGEWQHLRDRSNRPFDPALHVTNSDGSPKLTKLGALRVRRASVSIPPPRDQPKPAAEPTDAPPDYAGTAKLVVASFIIGAKSLGGDEWEPDEPSEREGLEAAWESYLRARGIGDLPPGLILCVAMGTYSLKRVQRPTTRGRLAGWWVNSRIRRTWRRWTGKRDDARAHSRADGDRQDDAGDDASAGVRTGVQSPFVDGPRPVR